jgi:UDP-N-acetylglucosamine 2-epimerase
MPEEINRILTDHVSTLLFSPSEKAVGNLKLEGFRAVFNGGHVTSLDFPQVPINSKADANNPLVLNIGDVMQDVLLYAIEIAETRSSILERTGLERKNYSLLTIHRAENTDIAASLEKIIDFVNSLSDTRVTIFPIHPRTKKVCERVKKRFSDNIRIIRPLGYFDTIMLLKNSAFVMTDSGGMQREAYWLKAACITLRDETEWTETIEDGWNVVYRDFKEIEQVSGGNRNRYGDGKASVRIIKATSRFLGR